MHHRSAFIILVFAVLVVFSSASHSAPAHQWSKRFGDSNIQSAYAVTVDPSGNVVVAGEMRGTTDFGGGPLVSGVNSDIFVAKFDPAGNHLWSKKFGTAGGTEGAHGVACDAAGNVIICGSSDGVLNFGGGNIFGIGAQDMFIAKLNSAGGFVWAKRFGAPNLDFPPYFNLAYEVATDSGDNVVVTGYMQGQIDFGGGDLTAQDNDIFVVKFSAAGTHVWSKRFGGANSEVGYAIAIDSGDNVVLTGLAGGATNFGGGSLGPGGFLVKLDPAGSHVWSKAFTGGLQSIRDVALDGAGNAIVTGDFSGPTNFGGGPLASTNFDVFVVKYDAGGAHQWSKKFGGAGNEAGSSVATDMANNVILTGAFPNAIDFGGGPLTTAGSYDITLAKLAGDGTHIWSVKFGDSNFQHGYAVATDNAGAIVITGEISGSPDFGGGPLSGFAQDVLVAKFQDDEPVPVLISGFKATARAGAVEIRWDLWSDEGLAGITLYRRAAEQPAPIAVAEMTSAARTYIDTRVEPGNAYHYELVVRTSGGEDLRSLVATATVPLAVAVLGQNHPNPFNPSTTIEFTLSEKSPAVIAIYDGAGALVVRLDQGVREAGTHHVEWNGRDANSRSVASGVYFYRLEGNPSVSPRKMVLLK